ncbi:MAG: APC family permease [Acidimicrobiia bacterium]
MADTQSEGMIAASGDSGGLIKSLTTLDVFIAGVGLVVAASTLVSDFVGWFTAGRAFAVALIAMFVVNLFLGLAASELATTYPKAGALYDFGAAAVGGGEQTKAFVGIFLGILFYIMFAFAGGGETVAGASGAQGLFNAGSLGLWVFVLSVLAILPNLFGISLLAKVELYTVLVMLAIRWFFGVTGFLGANNVGSWSWSNVPGGELSFAGIIALGGAYAFWSFVGIEFVAPLAEETRDPGRSIPRGIVLGLLAILGTSLLMGIGVAGLNPDWASQIDLNAPQLAVGQEMFGDGGRVLMAIASVLATYSSMTIVYAAMPRILYGMSRNGHFFGPLSRWFGTVHPRFRTPWVAIFFTGVVYTATALAYGQVAELIFTAAYVWLLLYVVYSLLVVVSRYVNPNVARPFKLPILVPIVGFLVTLYMFWAAFKDPIEEGGPTGHAYFGGRALWMIGGAIVVAIIGIVLEKTSGVQSRLEQEVHQEA